MIKSDILKQQYKILISDEAHSKRVQNDLFKLGYTWGGRTGQVAQYTTKQVIWAEFPMKRLAYSDLYYVEHPLDDRDRDTPWYKEHSNSKFNTKSKIIQYDS